MGSSGRTDRRLLARQLDESKQRRRQDAVGLQDRIARIAGPLPASAEDLVQDIRVCLLRAVDDGRITSPRNEIWAIKATPGESKRILITGGEKDYQRDKSRKHFAVEGGAWFDFAITVEMSDAGLSLYSYNFEIRFGAKESPAFLRFDLNSPVHDNAALGFRSHLHPGTDDWSVPAAILTPVELIDLFTYGIFERRRRGRTKATSRKRSARS